jgi:hypothetical protein
MRTVAGFSSVSPSTSHYCERFLIEGSTATAISELTHHLFPLLAELRQQLQSVCKETRISAHNFVAQLERMMRALVQDTVHLAAVDGAAPKCAITAILRRHPAFRPTVALHSERLANGFYQRPADGQAFTFEQAIRGVKGVTDDLVSVLAQAQSLTGQQGSSSATNPRRVTAAALQAALQANAPERAPEAQPSWVVEDPAWFTAFVTLAQVRVYMISRPASLQMVL